MRPALLAWVVLAALAAHAADAADAPKFAAKVPLSITTPDSVQTRLGTLRFFDGLPDKDSVQRLYDNLDFARGVEAFLSGVPAASAYAACAGLDSIGIEANRGLGITEELMDARSLFLTPNSTTVYVFTCIDLAGGPVVVEVPPNVLGPVDDAYFRFVTDLGLTGPDRGKGGKYLFVPPGYGGQLPAEGHFLIKSPTYRNLVLYRAFVEKGDVPAAVKAVKDAARVYPLADTRDPPQTVFVDTSGKQFNTIHANDFHFYEELDAVIQHEPADAFDPEIVGLLASIGIKKGQPFAPDSRLKATLTDAVAVGNATARAISFAPRDRRALVYPDRHWITPFIGGSYQFLADGERILDARTLFHYMATGITPAMAAAKPGTGSAYAGTVRDAKGEYLDGGKTYRVTLPAPVPAKQFWSFTVYSNQTRSMLETDQKLAGLDSTLPAFVKNDDGSATVWFGPKPPPGKQGNWVQTMPGKGFNVLLRLYGPLEPWFDQSWKPGDLEEAPASAG